MSSIASPSTTTRRSAILASSVSMRSRDRRLSGMGLRKRRGVMRAISDGKRAEELRLRNARHMAKIADEVHAAVRRDLKISRLHIGSEGHAHDPFDHAREQHGRTLVPGDQWMRLARIALALTQYGEFRLELHAGARCVLEFRGRLVVVIEIASRRKPAAAEQRYLKIVLVAVREVRHLGVEKLPGGTRSAYRALRAHGESVAHGLIVGRHRPGHLNI